MIVFQKKAGLEADGKYGDQTHATLMDAVADADDSKEQPDTNETDTSTEENPTLKQVRIICSSGSVNIRRGNSTQYGRITSAKNGTTFEWIATAENGWHAVVVNGQVGWVFRKYSKVVE